MMEANNPEINVDELMHTIREEVVKRQAYSQKIKINLDSNLDVSKLQLSISYMETFLNNAESRSSIRTKWPDKLNFFPFNFSTKFQKIIIKVINFIFKDQREVNFNVINSLKESLAINYQLIAQIATLKTQVDNRIQGLDESTVTIDNSIQGIDDSLNAIDTLINSWLTGIQEGLDTLNMRVQGIDEHLSSVDKLLSTTVIENLPACLEVAEESYINTAISLSKIPIEEHCQHDKKDLFYYLFENVFYNSETVKEKQKIYLKFIDPDISQLYRFFDAGCGRGEFIQNLTENNIKYIGVDLNKLEIDNLRKSGFDVYESDILAYLESHDEQYCGISAFQVVEHLNFQYIHKFLSISFEKLVNNGVIIIETVNPHSLYGLSNFYQDPTHIKPIPPEMLKFILEWHGFKSVKIIYSSLIPESVRIFKIQKMNYQDYAVVGYKRI
ncbi:MULTISPECIES: methyltransferase domain-containing protein [unclassified Nostoc]|uniref:methyltransferase domain-containing protein n=1 Tax=unclassified Nostoc TaxID=2593658 RepID=UPI001D828A92|nr:methyltransferase domain-containing protein [Nostoc sp. JL23]MBN3881137.1 methyltransferase domain-containing protein [Nostoc sp. JL23]